MGIADTAKKVYEAGAERATNAWTSMRSGIGGAAKPASAIPAGVDYSGYEAPPSSRGFQPTAGQGKSFPFDGTKYSMGSDGMLKPNAAIDPTKAMTPPTDGVTPQQRLSPGGIGAPTPGVMSRANDMLKGKAGVAGSVLTAGLEGANTYRDVTTPGMETADKVARVAEGIGRGAGAIAGGALGATAGSVVPVVGTTIGGIAGGALGYMAPDLANKAVNFFTGNDTQLASDKAAGLRAAAPVVPAGPPPGAPAASPALTPAAAPVARPALERVGGAEGDAIARGVRNREITLADVPQGGGYVVGPRGQVTRINPQPKEQPAAPQGDDVERMLMSRINGVGTNLRGQREALNQLANYRMQKEELGVKRTTAERELAKFNADLGDKRMKEFSEQHVNNQFYKDKIGDKGQVVGREADAEKNARFLDFMRQTDPRFGQEGLGQIWQLSPQDRNRLVADMRKAFVEKEGVEAETNKNAWFTKPGISNSAVTVASPREANVGDIPRIGMKNYLWSNMPFTNRDVVDTSSGTVLAEDYIGEGEGSAGRRAKIYPGKK